MLNALGLGLFLVALTTSVVGCGHSMSRSRGEGPPGALSERPDTFENRAISSNDIYLGMPVSGVKASWGEPLKVETAGVANTDYQKWHYEVAIPSLQGFITEHRNVFIDHGRVVGWETR